MSWHHVRGTIIGDGILENQVRIEGTLLVETEHGERVVIAPKKKMLNRLAMGDVIEFDTKRGKDVKLTWFLGRVKRNCRKLRVVTH